MKLNKKFNFIVIDDSLLDCFIAEKIIHNTGKAHSIKTFHHGEEALNYMTMGITDDAHHTIVLVDIQMPLMTGFEFVREFEKLPPEVTGKFSIYMISSSINDSDLNKVGHFASINQFLNKPITSNNLSLVISKS